MSSDAAQPGREPVSQYVHELFVVWPMMVSTAWLNMVWEASHPWRFPHKPEHADLPIPDPIEEEGERALFA